MTVLPPRGDAVDRAVHAVKFGVFCCLFWRGQRLFPLFLLWGRVGMWPCPGHRRGRAISPCHCRALGDV